MNEKQKKFCDEYLKDFNRTAAAIRAGYSERSAYNTGYRIMKRPEAKEYIDKKLRELNGTQKEEVLEYLTAVMRGEKWGKSCMPKDSGLPPEKDGEITVKDRMKAAELLAKLCGAFSEKGGEEMTPIIISGENDLQD
ncbi:MAG: terminase small subunit [Ruminiclostridium sp.]|nr:terminase small subunit [Ruminiclostridium sp.]